MAMTDFPLVSGDWSAVDFGNYADEVDEEEEEGPPGFNLRGGGSSVSPLFVELSLSSTGYPDEALVGGTLEQVTVISFVSILFLFFAFLLLLFYLIVF